MLKIQQLTPAASTLTAFSAVPTNKQWLWDINVCNRSSVAVTISIAVTLNGTTTYYNHDSTLPAGASYERTGRKLPAGGVISVRASAANVDFTLEYVEE